MPRNKKKSYKHYSKIINQMQNIRRKNNKNWMDLLRLAYKKSPKEASTIVRQIFKEDKNISRKAKLLCK